VVAVGIFVFGVLTFAQAAQNVLTWTDMANNEDGFTVQSKVGGCASATAWGTLGTVGINVQTYTHSPVNEGSTYAYQVNAYNTAGASAWSNCAERLVPYTIPIQPTNAALALVAGKVVVSWLDVASNETGYKVQKKPGACTGTGTWAPLASVGPNVQSYTDGAVVQGQRYCYGIASTNSAGDSAYTSAGDILVPFTVPAAPAGLSIAGG